ncbi:competence protein ComJ [Burkholderia sp. A9]|uniref:competence protein ComJ n=1 Tax=Burkholderia sp. A9 TaxID=1365108 RepID=UPI001F33BF04|nr:competence protein ComJ [Burkholderia sp. A9]
MSGNLGQTVDLLISHSQILVRSRPYDEGLIQWGTGNRDQGAVLHDDYVIFDPLPDDAFGAKVYLRVADKFEMASRRRDALLLRFVSLIPARWKLPRQLKNSSLRCRYRLLLTMCITRSVRERKYSTSLHLPRMPCIDKQCICAMTHGVERKESCCRVEDLIGKIFASLKIGRAGLESLLTRAVGWFLQFSAYPKCLLNESIARQDYLTHKRGGVRRR